MKNTTNQPQPNPERSVPHNLDAERALLGSILLDNSALNYAVEILKSEDFYSESHRLAFKGMVKLSDSGRTIDLVTISEYLAVEGNLERCGGAGYLAALTDGVPIGTMSGMSEYCRIIKDKSTIRSLIGVGDLIVQRCLASTDDALVLLEDAQTAVFDLATKKTSAGLQSAGDIFKESIGAISKVFQHGQTLTGIETGLTDFDSLTCGLQNQELIVVAGRPSQGKTALALTIASHAAIKNKKSVAFFSFEMAKEALLTRLICSEAWIDSHKVRTGFSSTTDWNRAVNAIGQIGKSNLYIDDAGESTVMQIRAKARRHKAEKGLDLVIVDYLQLIAAGGKFENRTQEVTFISKSLKALAKELKVPVVALSQLKRPADQRSTASRRPQLSDLRESGSIEQDADVVVMIYVKKKKKDEEEESAGSETTLILGKQRNGPTGDIPVVFLKNFGIFKNRVAEHNEPSEPEERMPYSDD